jgi:ribosomal protein RSM22 (predicted rRNA methylase)
MSDISFPPLDQLKEGIPLKALTEAYEALSARYRTSQDSPQIQSYTEAVAYTMARMPATLAVTNKILQEIIDWTIMQDVKTWTDFGAGPGTIYWALNQWFPQKFHLTLYENNPYMQQVAGKLLPTGKYLWQNADFAKAALPKSDIISCSYVLNELEVADATALVSRAWHQANKAFIIIEPGTPKGYEHLMAYRKLLINQGAFMAAPCGHNSACPLLSLYEDNMQDWCHFGAFVERSYVHQLMKQGTMGHETEKFCYLIALKQSPTTTANRILKPPMKRTGHVHLELCTSKGVNKTIIRKRDKDHYKKARKTHWGDRWENLSN